MENKYYTPKREEFHFGFEYEFRPRVKNGIFSYIRDEFEYVDWWKKQIVGFERSDNIFDYLADKDDPYSISDVTLYLRDGAVRVKYLDEEDIESLGFKKSLKNQWIGWNDYYSGDVSGEYGYFLYVTLHLPRLYNKSSKLEDNLFKIIIHRYYDSNEDETTNINEKLEQNESEVIYKGTIKNKSELKQILNFLGVK